MQRGYLLFMRAVCVLCGVLGLVIFVECDIRGGEYVWLGIVCLLVGLVASSFVTREW
jgi:hypothetical protein